jgi:magnesium-transporting ATPase (P-type)
LTSIEHDSTNNPDAFTTKVELHNDMKALVKECILNNTDVRIETNDAEFKYEPKGQALEVGLINFLVDNNEDVLHSFVERNRNQPKLALLPFDQVLKRKTVIR